MRRTNPAARLGAALILAALAAPATAGAQVGKSSGVLEANLATREQLAALPGVDAALAEAIVAGRPYKEMLALDAVVRTRLDDAQRAELYQRLFLPINLNTASREEILLVPGVGARMAREFEEYRPYRAMAQFRREIGKYVDAAEVARLERYVTIGG